MLHTDFLVKNILFFHKKSVRLSVDFVRCEYSDVRRNITWTNNTRNYLSKKHLSSNRTYLSPITATSSFKIYTRNDLCTASPSNVLQKKIHCTSYIIINFVSNKLYVKIFDRLFLLPPHLQNGLFDKDFVRIKLIRHGKNLDIVDVKLSKRHYLNNYFIGHYEGMIEDNLYVLTPMRSHPQKILVKNTDPLFVPQLKSCYSTTYDNWDEKLGKPIFRIVEKIEEKDQIDTMTKILIYKNSLTCYLNKKESIVDDHSLVNIDLNDFGDREDFTGLCVFTVDPSTAKDLDDALSFKLKSDGDMEIGIHIADVSWFVKKGSNIDDYAVNNLTSVYFPHKCFHMLPESLSGNLCSLLPGENKFAVSLIFTVNKNFEIVSHKLSRSVIRSCAKLNYVQADELMNLEKTQSEYSDILVYNGFNIDDIRCSLHIISEFVKCLQKKNNHSTDNLFDNKQLKFNLDPTTNIPYSFEIKNFLESNYLIQEMMILANTTIAKIINHTHPRCAFLRIHPQPDIDMSKIKNIVGDSCNQLDLSNFASLNQSINTISSLTDEKTLNMYKMLLLDGMNVATYSVSSGNKKCLSHYNLNEELYTHFTSPIRRMADIIVHRLLFLSSTNKYSTEELKKLALNCTNQTIRAKICSYDMDRYFLWLLIKYHGPINIKANLKLNYNSGIIVLTCYSLFRLHAIFDSHMEVLDARYYNVQLSLNPDCPNYNPFSDNNFKVEIIN